MPIALHLSLIAWFAVLLLPAAADAAPASIVRGFADGAFTNLVDGEREQALANARAAGAGFVRLDVAWRQVAPAGRRKPRGFHAADPADPRYRWKVVDRAVRESAAAGLEPLVVVVSAPDWAEGSDRPRRRTAFTRAGTWKPRPSELAAFLTAAAHRYDGRFTDPRTGGVRLPRVRNWQIWNEPNLWPFLQPQWQHRGRWIKSGARHYRRMLNAAYGALKQVRADNRVIAGGLAPFGDHRPARTGGRVAPARFLRALLCLAGRRTLRRACRARTSFDAYAFHPYSLGGPRRHALNPDDTTIPDGRKLTRVVRQALRYGTARPRRPKELWATEMGWDTRPPNPFGLHPRTQARYLNDSLYVLWRSGVSRAVNFLLRDSGGARPRRLIDPGRRRSGVFYRRRTVARDTRKPSFSAIRFPFVVVPATGRSGRAWGAPPCPEPACTVVIEFREKAGWRRAASIAVRSGEAFRHTVTSGRTTVWRARLEGTAVASLTTLPRRL